MTIQQLAARILEEVYEYSKCYYLYTQSVYSSENLEKYEEKVRLLNKKLKERKDDLTKRNRRYEQKIAVADITIEEYLEKSFPRDWRKFCALLESGLNEQEALDKLTERTSYLEPIEVSYWFWESAYYLTIPNGEFLWRLNMTKEIIHKYNPAITALKEEIKTLQDEIRVLEKKIANGPEMVEQFKEPKAPEVPESREKCIKLIQDLYNPRLRNVTCKVVRRRIGLGDLNNAIYMEYDLYCEDGVVPVFRTYSEFDPPKYGIDREIYVKY